MKKRELIHMFVFFVSLVMLAACGIKEQNNQTETIQQDENSVTLTDAQLRNASIETMQLSVKHISTILKLNGKIDVPPQNMISVSAVLGGYLKSTNLLPGMKVSKGQVIAIIENPQFVFLQQEYLTAKSKLHFAELDYKRQKELNEAQASSDKIMQQAQAEMNSQQIQMNAIAQQLLLININPANVSPGNIVKNVPIYSSINGYVSKINVNTGKYVNPSDILFELINPSDIHLNLKVYEKDLGKLKARQNLVAYTNTDPGKKYPCEIHLISRSLDENGITDIHCHFGKYDRDLIPGTYMNAEIQTQSSFANALPEESIVDFEGVSYVFVEEKKQTYRFTPVKVGETEKEFVQILNYKDLDGKNIVTKNAYTLLMKLKNTEDED